MFFFDTGKLHKEVNSTVTTLIPKVPNPSYITDFRPIACNVMYKCITKILNNRLRGFLGVLVDLKPNSFL